MKEEGKYGEGYLEERVLIPRWRAPWPQIVNFLFLIAIFVISWYIFQDRRGILRLYTPYVGYMYTRWFLIILIWVVYIMEFWPFKRYQLNNWHPLKKGLIFTGISTIVLLLLIHGFFEFVLGNLAMTYFNPTNSAKLGIPPFFAHEYAALACLMFAAIASWMSPAWVIAVENAPWQKLRQPIKGFTILIVTFFISTLIYLCTMHSHMGILYNPWQRFAAIAPPWWENLANTVSGNFHVAWIMCCTIVVWLYESIWERKFLFGEIKNDTLRRFVSFFGIFLIGIALFFFIHFVQELWWGPAIRGTRMDNAPDWRWLHVGETIVFFLIPALFITFYCNNWPRKYSRTANILIRTLLVTIGGVIVYWLYYKYANLLLGIQPGFAQPEQFPMIPTIWFINLMLLNNWFMDNWPGWRRAKPEEIEKIRSQIKEKPEGKTSYSGVFIGILIGVILFFTLIFLFNFLIKYKILDIY